MLKSKEQRLRYLSNFFESTAEKMEAAKKALERYEKNIEDAEKRSKKLDFFVKQLIALGNSQNRRLRKVSKACGRG
jgi:hypothetical protein